MNGPSEAGQRRSVRRLLVSQFCLLVSLVISLVLRRAENNRLPWTLLIGAMIVACPINITMGVNRLRKPSRTGAAAREACRPSD
jgi:hypothetical protein